MPTKTNIQKISTQTDSICVSDPIALHHTQSPFPKHNYQDTMKKYILAAAVAASSFAAFAQDFDVDPTLKISNNENKVNFTVGARFMADAAVFDTEATPLNSGASIADARIRTSMKYGENWYFYADFGFGAGKFSQKNIFLEYSKRDATQASHAVKVGYYGDPAGSMSRQTSLGGCHFISRPGSAETLGLGRELGVSYKYSASNVFLFQGVFTENQYNKIDADYNGLSASGRWIYRHIDKSGGGHVGASARYAHLGGGEEYASGNSTYTKKHLILSQALETYVDDNKAFVNCNLPWAHSVIDFGGEALWFGGNYFVRGEYRHKIVTKKRDSKKVYDAAREKGEDTWGSYDAWLAANPLRTNHFNGAYLEAGYKIFGGNYKYDMHDAVLGGMKDKSLEVVGRVSYTNLNDIASGEHYSEESGKYFPNGYDESKPYESASVGGGRIISATLGVNYAFNKYAQVMLHYTYSNLDKDALPGDSNFHQVQARVQFTF